MSEFLRIFLKEKQCVARRLLGVTVEDNENRGKLVCSFPPV